MYKIRQLDNGWTVEVATVYSGVGETTKLNETFVPTIDEALELIR